MIEQWNGRKAECLKTRYGRITQKNRIPFCMKQKSQEMGIARK